MSSLALIFLFLLLVKVEKRRSQSPQQIEHRVKETAMIQEVSDIELDAQYIALYDDKEGADLDYPWIVPKIVPFYSTSSMEEWVAKMSDHPTINFKVFKVTPIVSKVTPPGGEP